MNNDCFDNFQMCEAIGSPIGPCVSTLLQIKIVEFVEYVNVTFRSVVTLTIRNPDVWTQLSKSEFQLPFTDFG